MPDTSNSSLSTHEPELAKQLIFPTFEAAKTPRKEMRPPSPIPSTSKEIVYETAKHGYIPGDDDDGVTEEEAQMKEKEEGENFGTVASLPRSSRRFLDTQYGIRKDGEQLMISDSPVFVDPDDNITIKGTAFRGTEGLWELLTHKNVNTQLIGLEDLKTYKKVLILTNAIFEQISAWR